MRNFLCFSGILYVMASAITPTCQYCSHRGDLDRVMVMYLLACCGKLILYHIFNQLKSPHDRKLTLKGKNQILPKG